MGLILRTDPHSLMWKVMTSGCSSSQYILTVLYLMGLAGIEIVSGLHHYSRLSRSKLASLANGCTLYISTAADNFHMDHSPWRLLYYHFTVTFSVLLSALLNILHYVFRGSAQIKKKNLQQRSVCT